MKKWLSIPWYPFFLAAYPIAALLSFNLGQAKYVAGIRPTILSLVIALVLLFLLRIFYRDWHRAAFAAGALVFLFFLYGHVYDLISAKWKNPDLMIWMLAIWFALIVFAFVLAGLHKLHFQSAALTLNVISLGLMLYPIVQIVQFSIANSSPPTKSSPAPIADLRIPQDQALPDVYYIMPEDYGRVDYLQQSFHIDVSSFMQFLTNNGFYVAGCSQSNYAMSELSLGSALNMDYLQNLGPAFSPKSVDQGPIWDAIRYSAVSGALKQVGYKTVAFATGFAWSELDNSDVYISPSPLLSGMTNFEDLLLRTTPARHLEDFGILNLDQIDGERYRERTMLEFNSMSRLAHMPGPKFVFVHIISPHEPFVFDANGTPIDPATFLNRDRLYTFNEYVRGYQGQVPFVDQMLEKSITTLIRESSRPLVIILQTDTGPLFTNGSDQFKILNAYYMPGHTDQLYSSISPVNTFRVIFNAYLGTDYPLLKDISYDSPIPHIYDYSEVSNPCSDH